MSTRRDYRKGLFSPAEIAFAQAAEAQYNEAPQGAFFLCAEHDRELGGGSPLSYIRVK